ncbi:MAG: RNA polymerase sigma factor RpoE [Pseudomonadota bacterium]
MKDQESDQQLVERVQKGDNRAFDVLVLKYQHKIISLVMRFVHDHAEAQDITQEAFIKAYRALPKFRGDSQFYTWLYRIAINTAKNHLVSRKRKIQSSGIDVEEGQYFEGADKLRDTSNPESLMQRDDLERQLKEVLKQLPDELRTALTLREFNGLSYEDIADVMDCPVGTVRSRIFRAREALEKVIDEALLDSH